MVSVIGNGKLKYFGESTHCQKKKKTEQESLALINGTDKIKNKTGMIQKIIEQQYHPFFLKQCISAERKKEKQHTTKEQ